MKDKTRAVDEIEAFVKKPSGALYQLRDGPRGMPPSPSVRHILQRCVLHAEQFSLQTAKDEDWQISTCVVGEKAMEEDGNRLGVRLQDAIIFGKKLQSDFLFARRFFYVW